MLYACARTRTSFICTTTSSMTAHPAQIPVCSHVPQHWILPKKGRNKGSRPIAIYEFMLRFRLKHSVSSWGATIIGERLRALREEKKFSQAEVEDRMGLLRCYISLVENGHTVPAAETLEKLARALEVPMHQLFYDGENPPKLPNRPKGKTANGTEWGSKGNDAHMPNQFCRFFGRMNREELTMVMFMARKSAKQNCVSKLSHRILILGNILTLPFDYSIPRMDRMRLRSPSPAGEPPFRSSHFVKSISLTSCSTATFVTRYLTGLLSVFFTKFKTLIASCGHTALRIFCEGGLCARLLPEQALNGFGKIRLLLKQRGDEVFRVRETAPSKLIPSNADINRHIQ